MKEFDGKNYCAYVNKKGTKCPNGAYKKFKKTYLCRGHWRLAAKKS